MPCAQNSFRPPCTGVGEPPLLRCARRRVDARNARGRDVRVMEKAIEAHQPPLVRGRRIKLRYAHQGGKNPPRIIVHGNQTHAVPDAYKRYLSNVFREAFDLFANPVMLEFRTDTNPYDRRKERKVTSKPDVVDRSTTKGKTGGKAQDRPKANAKVQPSKKKAPAAKPKPVRHERSEKPPKPGSSRSGKDNRRGPRVRAAAGKATAKRRKF